MKIGSQVITIKNTTDHTWKAETFRYFDLEANVEIVVDVAALLNTIGRKAVENKSGRAVEASGAVVAQVIGQKKRLNVRPGEFFVSYGETDSEGFQTRAEAERHQRELVGQGVKWSQIRTREKK